VTYDTGQANKRMHVQILRTFHSLVVRTFLLSNQYVLFLGLVVCNLTYVALNTPILTKLTPHT